MVHRGRTTRIMLLGMHCRGVFGNGESGLAVIPVVSIEHLEGFVLFLSNVVMTSIDHVSVQPLGVSICTPSRAKRMMTNGGA